MMETEKRLGILDKLYAIYDNFIQTIRSPNNNPRKSS